MREESMRGPIKKTLSWLHRWGTLAALPLFAVIIVSGLVLAAEPILRDLLAPPPATAPVPVERLIAVLETIDPRGQARALQVEAGGQLAVEFSRQGQREMQVFDLASAAALGPRPVVAGFFHTIATLHKSLLLDADWLVEWASYAMLLVLLLGPWLAWPRRRRSLLGWHILSGWIGLPLALLLAVTGVLLALDLGTAPLPPIDRDARPMPLTLALERAAQRGRMERIVRAERLQRAAVAVTGRDDLGQNTLVVTRTEIARVPRWPGLVQQLHAGSWAGAWSGALNLVGALLLAFLLYSGVDSWWRRQWRRRTAKARRAAQTTGG